MALHVQMSDEPTTQLKRARHINRFISPGICTGLLLRFVGVLFFTILSIRSEAPADMGGCTQASDDIYFDAEEGLGEGIGIGCFAPGDTNFALELEGTFYDLKMTRSGEPSKIPDCLTKDDRGIPFADKNGRPYTRLMVNHGRSGHEFYGEVARFLSQWDERALDAYYRSPTKLYASCFYLPSVQSGYAPKAFRCDDASQPGGWLCVYRGLVRAPQTGKFRFVGAGDDFIAVRFNNRTVLEAGYHHPSLWNKDDPAAVFTYGPPYATGGGWKKFWDDVKAGKYKDFAGYELIRNVPRITRWNNELGGLTAGTVFEVNKGQVYPIEVAVGDTDGMMGFVLLIEDVTHAYTSSGRGYELFRTRFTTPCEKELRDTVRGFTDGDELQAPPYEDDSFIWSTVP